ncbi:hypothetical protein LMH87_011356 [Akanthomyces muscarius]|uniref:Uncharacterized protein n=1 Tax=Akanthomyces muscarius TaxID=2231603 RepID=A0A9W8Q906_AKAMU|nr:hypothetical protein LMH87_011356 [Akanthomyces muscarius]KAJ4150614.1 hypothetical protein LMH87_011356 [Akanthomyces muscarius]
MDTSTYEHLCRVLMQMVVAIVTQSQVAQHKAQVVTEGGGVDARRRLQDLAAYCTCDPAPRVLRGGQHRGPCKQHARYNAGRSARGSDVAMPHLHDRSLHYGRWHWVARVKLLCWVEGLRK